MQPIARLGVPACGGCQPGMVKVRRGAGSPVSLRCAQRLTDFLALDRRAANDSDNPRPLRDRLIAAVVDGPPDADIPALRAAAHAEEMAMLGKVTSRVRTGVLARMVEIYDAVAIDNYGKVTAQFDSWATKFATTAAAVDVEADGADMVDKSDKDRKSWLDSQRFATQLTRLMSALYAAAQLTGKVPEAVKKREGGGRDAVLIPLCVKTTDQHRRVVWEAWECTGGRCGRWAALSKAGVPIRALPADQLADFEGYRPPKPLQERWIPVAPLGTSVRQIVDPEDPEPPELPQPAKFGRLAP